MLHTRFSQSVFFLSILFIVFSSCEKDEPESQILPNNVINENDTIESDLYVGTAVVDITPLETTGVNLEGYEPRTSDGVHDALTARCIVIIDTKDTVALISLDLVGINFYQSTNMKNQISRSLGIKSENIFIHAIHTHSGPSIIDGMANQTYVNSLYNKVAKLATNALSSAVPAKAVIQSGKSTAKTVNRRNPERALDNNFFTITFRDRNSSVVATLLNFGCHPVVLGPDNKEITADYVHYLRKYTENINGGISVFFNGCMGNVNPESSNTQPYNRSNGTFEQAQLFGEELGKDMLENYLKTDTLDINLNVQSKQITVSAFRTHLSVLDLGSVQIAMVPGEPLDTFGKDMEALLPGPYKMVFGIMNDHIGYLIPEYEWGNCSNSFKPECFEETISKGESTASTILENLTTICNEMYGE